MKTYTFRVTIKTDAAVTVNRLEYLLETGVGCANGCGDPEDMIDGPFTVRAEALPTLRTGVV